MVITKIMVKEGRLMIDFTPSDKEKTSVEFDSNTNKLIVETSPCAIDISHKDGKFTIRSRGAAEEKPEAKSR